MTDFALRQRFLAFVPDRKPGACWLWAGAKDRDGYGVISNAGKTLAAHRVSYELHHRKLPPCAVVMHSCDTPACVNPAHLKLGTKRTNAIDMTDKGRRASKLSHARVAEIRAGSPKNPTTAQLAEIAAANDVSVSTIRSILAGRSWR